jgi:hypothetical protein
MVAATSWRAETGRWTRRCGLAPMRTKVSKLAVEIVMGLAHAAVLGLLAWALSRTRYPRLAPPDPAFSLRPRDRVVSVASVLLALAVGAFAGWRLSLVPPPEIAGALVQHRAYDGAGRWLGPLFFALGVAAYVAYPIAARMMKKETLQHLLWRSAERFRRLDPRPITRSTAYVVLTIAVFAHMMLREHHVTVLADCVCWRDLPWEQESRRDWNELERIEIVEAFLAPTGNPVHRLTLRLVFVDGSATAFGRWAEWKPIELGAFSRVLAKASGKAVVRAPR